jgi:protein-S-isoprenylcysteine O-methyltransferase Ste14
MRALLSGVYSLLTYLIFFITFCYAIGFVERVIVPKDINTGVAGDVVTSLLVNAMLLGVFAIQHSVMARPAFKRMWTKIVPKEMERSTYVLFASAALALLMWQWRPMPVVVWSTGNVILADAITVLSWAGFGIVLLSTFLISHFHLFGLTQGMTRLMGLKEKPANFTTPMFYKWVRHPLYLGFIIAFWATPVMTAGHLFFAIMTTGYIFVGIFLEERDLVGEFGERYTTYRRNVGMIVPKIGKRRDREARN